MIVLAILLPIIEINHWCIDPVLRCSRKPKKGPEGERLCRAWCFRCSSREGG